MASELHLTFLVTPHTEGLLPHKDWERQFYTVYHRQTVSTAQSQALILGVFNVACHACCPTRTGCGTLGQSTRGRH